MKVSTNNVKLVSFSSGEKPVTRADKIKKVGKFTGAYAAVTMALYHDSSVISDKLDVANFSKLSAKDKTKNVVKTVAPMIAFPLLILAGLKVVINTIQKFEAKKTKEKWAEFERSFNK